MIWHDRVRAVRYQMICWCRICCHPMQEVTISKSLLLVVKALAMQLIVSVVARAEIEDAERDHESDAACLVNE